MNYGQWLPVTEQQPAFRKRIQLTFLGYSKGDFEAYWSSRAKRWPRCALFILGDPWQKARKSFWGKKSKSDGVPGHNRFSWLYVKPINIYNKSLKLWSVGRMNGRKGKVSYIGVCPTKGNIVNLQKSYGFQGIIQKKSVSGSRTLPCLLIFFRNFILIWKYQKGSLNRGTLVSATAIYQTRCPFTVLSALFLFFWTLPYDSKLFPGFCDKPQTVFESILETCDVFNSWMLKKLYPFLNRKIIVCRKYSFYATEFTWYKHYMDINIARSMWFGKTWKKLVELCALECFVLIGVYILNCDVSFLQPLENEQCFGNRSFY